jgi:hypothetical protein
MLPLTISLQTTLDDFPLLLFGSPGYFQELINTLSLLLPGKPMNLLTQLNRQNANLHLWFISAVHYFDSLLTGNLICLPEQPSNCVPDLRDCICRDRRPTDYSTILDMTRWDVMRSNTNSGRFIKFLCNLTVLSGCKSCDFLHPR